MPVDFHKYHALGNDYLVIDPNHTNIPLAPGAIQLICDRHLGVGSDGILYGPLFDGQAIGLRIFNPDGSEAEKSGNGIRIFARYLVDAGYVAQKQFALQTAGGEVSVEILDDRARLMRVDMGIVTFWSEAIPVAGERRDVVDEELNVDGERLRVTCLSIGNPHCVIPVDELSAEQAMRLGPLVEQHPMFPRRTNVQFLKVLDRRNLQIEIWERGAGYTLASGSSSCAAACAAHRLGWVDDHVTVRMPGGTMEIEIQRDGHVRMTGSVSSVARGEFSEELRAQLERN